MIEVEFAKEDFMKNGINEWSKFFPNDEYAKISNLTFGVYHLCITDQKRYRNGGWIFDSVDAPKGLQIKTHQLHSVYQDFLEFHGITLDIQYRWESTPQLASYPFVLYGRFINLQEALLFKMSFL